MYSLCSKLYTNYTLTIHWGVQNPTQNGAQTLHCNEAQFYLGAHLSKFEEGKAKFEEGKLKFEEGKAKFEEGKLKFEEGKF